MSLLQKTSPCKTPPPPYGGPIRLDLPAEAAPEPILAPAPVAVP